MKRLLAWLMVFGVGAICGAAATLFIPAFDQARPLAEAGLPSPERVVFSGRSDFGPFQPDYESIAVVRLSAAAACDGSSRSTPRGDEASLIRHFGLDPAKACRTSIPDGLILHEGRMAVILKWDQ